MKFENKGKWFNESEDTDKDMLNDEQQELAMEDDAGNLLAEDELDLADEDIDDDSEDIFNDEEQVDEACKRRNGSWSDLYPVVAEIGTDWEFYKKKPKYTRDELKQAAITKLKAKRKPFNSQDLEEALNRWYTSESAQKNEDFKNPKTYDELKPGEWYEVEGKLFQIADRQPIDNEVQAFKVFPDYSIGNGVHVLYKSFYKPDKFKFVNKKDKITKIIKEKEAQIAKLKQEINTLKMSL